MSINKQEGANGEVDVCLRLGMLADHQDKGVGEAEALEAGGGWRQVTQSW